jgi:hypothetical protein
MGLTINSVKLLLHARQLGVDYSRALTIGRQMVFLKDRELRGLMTRAGIPPEDQPDDLMSSGYAEPLFGALGAGVTDSLDASGYEGATMIHDLNVPLPDGSRSRYSVVVDGGSLEHVFNFPAAIKNCMDLLEQDGHYLGITPANNFLGHGFYQFSPELYYRIFSEANGFRMIKMYLFEDHRKASFYEVLDPLVLKQRVIMANATPSYLFVLARKIAKKEVFDTVPQQSDYEHIVWNSEATGQAAVQGKKRISRVTKVTRILMDRYRRRFRPMGNGNPQFIRKIDLTLSAAR